MCYLDNIKRVSRVYTRKDGRKVIIVYLNDGSQITKSYPKYLQEVSLRRELDRDSETIDHKNRDFTDDSASNIQIISRAENSRKSAIRCADIQTNCAQCGCEFILTKTQRKNRHRGRPFFCSKTCVGKYGKSVQEGSEGVEQQRLEVTYFRLDD